MGIPLLLAMGARGEEGEVKEEAEEGCNPGGEDLVLNLRRLIEGIPIVILN